MIRFNELKPGDLVMAEFEGKQWEGVVLELNHDEKEVCVETAVQQFWFTPEHLFPIPLDEEQLFKLGFERRDNPDGSVKYAKDSFRVQIPQPGNFRDLDIWYREDKRRLHQSIHVHDLQNHYLQMTKVELNPA
jgi:hypothetical protein